MKKLASLAGVICIGGSLFIGGYAAGSIENNEASREVLVGQLNDENPDQIDYSLSFTDTEDQSVVDNMIKIYLDKEKIETNSLEANKPDIYILMNSPKESVVLIDSKVWFSDEGAILGQRNGENWDKVDYYKINQDKANYIKEVIDF